MLASVCRLADSESGDSEDGLVDACRCQEVGRMLASVCHLMGICNGEPFAGGAIRSGDSGGAADQRVQFAIAANTAWASATVNLMHEKLSEARPGIPVAYVMTRRAGTPGRGRRRKQRRSGRANSRCSPLTAEHPRVCGGIGLEGLATPMRVWWHCPLCVCGGIALYGGLSKWGGHYVGILAPGGGGEFLVPA